jgi:nucleotide sugar dehydrogenase
LPEYNVAVIGLGKIGLPLAAQFAQSGLRVIGCDINPDVVAGVSAGQSHVKEEPGLDELVRDGVSAGRLTATTDTTAAVLLSNVVVVIVPVIVDSNHHVAYGSIDAATKSVAAGLQPGTLVIYETTLPVGTTRTRFAPALEQGSGLKAGHDFHLAFSPERVYSGRIFRDLHRYPKVVGGITPDCTEAAVDFYRVALEGAECLPMHNADTAELVKLMETTYRDVNIALANEFARFASDRGLPVDEAISAANTQPYSHIHRPGIAVGGHCIPVYPYFLIHQAGEGEMEIPRLARRINDDMAAWALGKLSRALGSLRGRRVLILGLSYRENVKEPIFSGALRLIAKLHDAGATSLVNDPLFTDDEIARYDAVPAPLDNLPPADALILQAYHDDYRSIDWPSLAQKGYRVILDGRNSLDPAEIKGAGMGYIGIGR